MSIENPTMFNVSGMSRGSCVGHINAALRGLDGVTDVEVCQCVARLTDTLKPEYAHALRRIEVDGIPVKQFAQEEGISSNNAGVRIFRARAALREQVALSCRACAERGCLDCTCAPIPAPGGSVAPA